MTGRHLTTAVTMLVLVGILVLGVFVGVRELFAPLPGSSGSSEETPVASPSCEPQDAPAGRLRSRQVTVNVFNGGTRAGLAGLTLERLTTRGFRAGEAGNAPTDSGVKRVQVWIVEGEETAGRLVARNFGPKVPVVEQEAADDLGEGVDVVVGNGLARLAAPLRSLKIAADQEVCTPAGDGS